MRIYFILNWVTIITLMVLAIVASVYKDIDVSLLSLILATLIDDRYCKHVAEKKGKRK